MKAYFTPHFQRSYQKLTKEVQRALDKQVVYLLEDVRYPSLRAKKFDEKQNIWQMRVTSDYRAYFEIKEGVFIFYEVRVHDD